MNSETSYEIVFHSYMKADGVLKKKILVELQKQGISYYFLKHLSKLKFFQPGDSIMASNHLNFLISTFNENYLSDKPKTASYLFSRLVFLLKSNPIPHSNHQFSNMLIVMFNVLLDRETEKQYTILNQINYTTSVFVIVHFAIVNTKYITEVVAKVFQSLKLFINSKSLDIWIETVSVLFSHSSIITFDHISVFSVVDMALSQQSSIQKKLRLLDSSSNFFNKDEYSLLLRTHFYSLISQIKQPISHSAISLALKIAKKTFEFGNQSIQHLQTTLNSLIPFIENNSNIEESLDEFVSLYEKNSIYEYINDKIEKEEFFRGLSIIIAKYHDDTILTKFMKPVAKINRGYQHDSVLIIAKESNFSLKHLPIMFSILNPEEFNHLENIYEKDPSQFISSSLLFVSTCFCIKKIIKISQFLISHKCIPVVKVFYSISLIASLSVFAFSSDNDQFSIFGLIHYLCYCYINDCETYIPKTSTKWEDIVFKMILPFESFYQLLINEALSRIRNAEISQAIFLAAISRDSSVFSNCILALKGNSDMIASLFTAGFSNLSTETAIFASQQIKNFESESKGSLLTSLFFKIEIPKGSIINSIIIGLSRITNKLSYSSELDDLFSRLFEYRLPHELLLLLFKSFIIFLESLDEPININNILDIALPRIETSSPYFEQLLVIVLKKDSSLLKNHVELIISLWFKFLNVSKSAVAVSSFESSLIEHSGVKISLPIYLEYISKIFVEGNVNENIFLSLNRIITNQHLVKSDLTNRIIPFIIINILNSNYIIRKSCLSILLSLDNVEIPESDCVETSLHSLDALSEKVFHAIVAKKDLKVLLSWTEFLSGISYSNSQSFLCFVVFMYNVFLQHSMEILKDHEDVILTFFCIYVKSQLPKSDFSFSVFNKSIAFLSQKDPKRLLHCLLFIEIPPNMLHCLFLLQSVKGFDEHFISHFESIITMDLGKNSVSMVINVAFLLMAFMRKKIQVIFFDPQFFSNVCTILLVLHSTYYLTHSKWTKDQFESFHNSVSVIYYLITNDMNNLSLVCFPLISSKYFVSLSQVAKIISMFPKEHLMVLFSSIKRITKSIHGFTIISFLLHLVLGDNKNINNFGSSLFYQSLDISVLKKEEQLLLLQNYSTVFSSSLLEYVSPTQTNSIIKLFINCNEIQPIKPESFKVLFIHLLYLPISEFERDLNNIFKILMSSVSSKFVFSLDEFHSITLRIMKVTKDIGLFMKHMDLIIKRYVCMLFSSKDEKKKIALNFFFGLLGVSSLNSIDFTIIYQATLKAEKNTQKYIFITSQALKRLSRKGKINDASIMLMSHILKPLVSENPQMTSTLFKEYNRIVYEYSLSHLGEIETIMEAFSI